MKGETLATYQSKSNSSKEYEIVRGLDGKTYCTCWPWKLNRTCSHLEDFLSTQSTYKVRKTVTAGKTDTYLELQEAINQAVKELRR